MKIAIAAILLFALSLGAQNQQLKTNQQAVTASAVALPALVTQYACVKVMTGGTQVVYIGNASTVTTGTGYPLSAGESLCLQVSNLNQVYVIAAGTGSTVAWFSTWNGPAQ